METYKIKKWWYTWFKRRPKQAANHQEIMRHLLAMPSVIKPISNFYWTGYCVMIAFQLFTDYFIFYVVMALFIVYAITNVICLFYTMRRGINYLKFFHSDMVMKRVNHIVDKAAIDRTVADLDLLKVWRIQAEEVKKEYRQFQ